MISDISFINRWGCYGLEREWRKYIRPLFQHVYPNHRRSAEWCAKLADAYAWSNHRFKDNRDGIVENGDMRMDYLQITDLKCDYDYNVEIIMNGKILSVIINDKELGTIKLPLIYKKGTPKKSGRKT
jgi:hypothetical protein